MREIECIENAYTAKFSLNFSTSSFVNLNQICSFLVCYYNSFVFFKLKVILYAAKITQTTVTEAPFTRVRTNFCTDKNLHGSTLHLQGTGGTGRIFERLSVQVWDLLFSGLKLAHLAFQKSVQFRRSHVNARWKRARFCPCRNLSAPV